MRAVPSSQFTISQLPVKDEGAEDSETGFKRKGHPATWAAFSFKGE
jgi:hypothetical protein